MRRLVQKIIYSARYPFMWAIVLYQKTLSPDHGPSKQLFPSGYCPFSPTCSDYGYQAYKKYGVIKGTYKTAWRIARCHPWTKGGKDLP